MSAKPGFGIVMGTESYRNFEAREGSPLGIVTEVTDPVIAMAIILGRDRPFPKYVWIEDRPLVDMEGRPVELERLNQ